MDDRRTPEHGYTINSPGQPAAQLSLLHDKFCRSVDVSFSVSDVCLTSFFMFLWLTVKHSI